MTAVRSTVQHTCPMCGTAFEGHPLAIYCGRRCQQRAYLQRRYPEKSANSLVPLPAELVERAFTLMRQGYATETAASVVGCTGKAVRNHLRRRGLTARTLRGPGVPILTRRFPCRYCCQPAREPGGVCEAALCRRRAWEELPEAERVARVDERRKGDRYATHVAKGRRVDVHILLSPEEAEQLREQAAIRGQSISSLVAEALAVTGLIDT
jgi:hypothetical protein